MEVSLHHLLILLPSLCHSLVCANFQWNPANPATYEEMSRSDNLKASLSLSLSCIFIAFLLFLFLKIRARFFPLPTRIAEAIKSCPTFDFSKMKELRVGNGAEECAVCLVEFQDSDTVKMLPLCQHVFHQRCIDQWLASRLTCPICRQKLISPDTEVNITDVPSEQEPEREQEEEEEEEEDGAEFTEVAMEEAEDESEGVGQV
ncbi:hypothetical protein VNO80_04962 [Phaseolus coccineus]|uniref:RING-type E3 ubiquitin transferase n=1 Tax=Phaseolus coccineus TaxID=3886 RepID=A0AAN9NUE0_PHACN